MYSMDVLSCQYIITLIGVLWCITDIMNIYYNLNSYIYCNIYTYYKYVTYITTTSTIYNIYKFNISLFVLYIALICGETVRIGACRDVN